VTGPSEEAIARAVDDLLTRASAQAHPDTTAATETKKVGSRRPWTAGWPHAPRRLQGSRNGPRRGSPPNAPGETERTEDVMAEQTGGEDQGQQMAEVIPLGIFDAHEEAKRWWCPPGDRPRGRSGR
jgi:hypothetical protein